jgi:endoglucanase
MKNLLLILTLAICFSGLPLSGQNGPAFEMNQRLGRGINIGNTFEAPSETAWSNPWNHDYARIIAELGFDHIRVPVRWEPRSLTSPPYTIDPVFFERIKSVIDVALGHKLHVIINMHHHESLLADPEAQKERFLSQWQQIADYFKDYPDSLLFEVFNEPHGNFTPEKWNVFFPEALERIRMTNPDRFVLLGTANWGGLGGLAQLVVPDDPNLILTVHYYSPFQFTHQGASWAGSDADSWLGTRWYDTGAERMAIESDFRAAVEFSQQHNIPVHVGEFGAYSRADMDSRERWTTFNARYFEELGFSWAYWEFSAGFGIYNPSTQQLRQRLVNALLHNPIGEPTEVIGKTVYASNFTASNDGWSLNSGGRGTLTRESGTLRVDITTAGTNAWDIQLVKSGIRLEKDKNYRATFKISVPQSRGTTAYAGRASSPWNSYSGYHGMTLSGEEQVYVYTFRMNNDTDPSARLVFDLGTSTTGIILHEFLLEETTIVIPYNLTVNAVNGSVLIEPETDIYMGGETYTLTAVPAQGYVFTGWSGDATGNVNPLQVYINNDKTFTANFSALYSLSVSAENGTVTVDPVQEEYVAGTIVTLTAVPDEGYLFSGWQGDASGNTNPLQVNMNANKTITALFSEIPVTWTLTLTAENGSVTVDPEKDEYQDGETVLLTAVPGAGYLFTGWGGDAESEENPLEITMGSDMNITAIFDIDTSSDIIPGGASSIQVFPNPLIHGNLTISLPYEADVSIYTITGKLHMRHDRVTSLEADRSLFDAGIYLIRITGGNTVRTVKLVVR